MEAIRRQEQRLYEAKKAQEKSKYESLLLGLPTKDRMKPKLFKKDFHNIKEFTGQINENDFQNMMKTNDRFISVEDNGPGKRKPKMEMVADDSRGDLSLDAHLKKKALKNLNGKYSRENKHTAQTNQNEDTDRTESSVSTSPVAQRELG